MFFGFSFCFIFTIVKVVTRLIGLASRRLPLVALMKCLLYFAGVLFSPFVSVDFCWNCGQ